MTSQSPQRQSPAVYRRRRLAALLVLVMTLIGLWWLVTGIIGFFTDDSDGEPTENTPEPTQGPEADAEAGDSTSGDSNSENSEDEGSGSEDSNSDGSNSEDSEDDGRCSASDLTVTASTNAESYGPIQAPLLVMEIENSSDSECTVDLGTAQQEFVVTSGGRQIFNTSQCGSTGDSEDSQLEVEMEPGQVERAQLTWPRSDSAEDCSAPISLEYGTYSLQVSVAGIESDPYEFVLREA